MRDRVAARGPASIQLDCFVYERSLYVQSHRWAQVRGGGADWACLDRAPGGALRIGDSLYDVSAKAITDAPERSAILTFRGYDPIPEGIVVFRFEPRTATGSPS